MPPYDPKANRPKLVPVDESAPVDALLGPSPDTAPAAPAPEPARSHLTVVPDDARSAAPPAPPAPTRRVDAKLLVAVAIGVSLAIGVVVAVRRRS